MPDGARRTSPHAAEEQPRIEGCSRTLHSFHAVASDRRPAGDRWLYELKLDGYRAIAFKRQGTLYLRSRNNKDFSGRYPGVVTALAKLPDDTVIDGELVAFDHDGRPSFNALQNYGSAPAPVVYYAFDVMVLAARDVMREPLAVRREVARAEGVAEARRASPVRVVTRRRLARTD